MRILIVTAHADDETIGCFTVMREKAAEVHILHATDSVPRNRFFAFRAGFLTRRAYRAARREEMQAVLAKAGIPAARYHRLDFADQEASRHCRQIRECVRGYSADRIYTHAYEGGHPDHDTLAFALAGLPNVWEFPLYHAWGASFVPQTFLNGPPEVTANLDPEARQTKLDWLGLFRSQQRDIRRFPIEREVFRPMRAYDFTRPPHVGRLYYEVHKLGSTWAEWRAAVDKSITLG